ncbi:MAG: leucine-rich repeat protein [Treponema sp.]|nr:leucine-rich repeat protein [Treponema sp.]
MKNTLFRCMVGGGFLFLLATLLFLLPGCKQSDSWEEPVAEYFDKYTNTAAIEKHEISCGYEKDAGGTSCISSYGNKTVSFYLRNAREYTLIPTFSAVDSPILIQQSSTDKSVITITYPQSYLIENDGGGEVGGTIRLQEEETLRDFESYSFSLKCNTPPPAIKGHNVNAAGGKYIVCFYIPTTELGSARHSKENHTLFINDTLVASGTESQIMSASATRPSNLTPLSGGTTFSSTAPAGYTAFYYETGTALDEDKTYSWSIYLQDEAGLSSKTVKVSSKVTPVNITITGSDVLEVSTSSVTFTASSDESNIESWTWTSSDPSVITVTPTAEDSSTASLTVSAGGVTIITAQATLSDGRIIAKEKTVRVLSLNLEGESSFLKGMSDQSLTPAALGFPEDQSYSWTSSAPSVASVNSTTSALTLSSKGKATISVSASYASKTVTATKEIAVHELKINGSSEVFTGEGNTLSLTSAIDSPSGSTAPSGISYSWQSSAASYATISNGTVTPVAPGSTTITLTATLNSKSVSVTKTVTVYKLTIQGNPLLKKGGGTQTFTATITPPPPSGTFTYGWTSGTTSTATVSGISTTGTITPKLAGSSEISFNVKKYGTSAVVASAKKTIYVISVTGFTNFLVGDNDNNPRALTVSPATIEGASYKWTSNNASVATVNQTMGKITPVADGTSNISLTVTKESNSLVLTTPIKVGNITFADFTDENGAEIAVGELFNYPLSSTTDVLTGCLVTEEIQNESIATASYVLTSTSKSLKIEGKTTGNTTIKLNITKSGYAEKATKTVKVKVIEAHEVAFNDLSTYLESLPANDKDHPYKLKIMELNESDLKYDTGGSPLTKLLNSSGKYVDLSGTTIPYVTTSGKKNLDNAFAGCTKLVVAPSIPDGVVSMGGCFSGCSFLKTPPATIPSSVTNMASCFWNCSKLETPPTLPNLVENIGGCFGMCQKLQSAPTIPSSVSNMENTFKTCTSLTGTVTINSTSVTEWKCAFLDCTNVTSVVVKNTTVKSAITNADGNSDVSGKITVSP